MSDTGIVDSHGDIEAPDIVLTVQVPFFIQTMSRIILTHYSNKRYKNIVKVMKGSCCIWKLLGCSVPLVLFDTP